jgi:hypothetical protein
MKWLQKSATVTTSHPAVVRVIQGGYRIEHDLSEPFTVGTSPVRTWLVVRVYDGDGVVGRAHLEVWGRDIWIGNRGEPRVLPDHRRRGICTAMYVYAELVTGAISGNSPSGRSDDAHQFWAQPDRPFGNRPHLSG